MPITRQTKPETWNVIEPAGCDYQSLYMIMDAVIVRIVNMT